MDTINPKITFTIWEDTLNIPLNELSNKLTAIVPTLLIYVSKFATTPVVLAKSFNIGLFVILSIKLRTDSI